MSPTRTMRPLSADPRLAEPSARPRSGARRGAALALGAVPLAAGLVLLLPACRSSAPEPEENSFLDVLSGAPGRPVDAEVGSRKGGLEEGEVEPPPDWELDPVEWELRLAEQEAGVEPEEAEVFEPPPQNPYLEFGSRIIVHDNGLIVKPYPLPLGKAEKILQFMTLYAAFPVESVDPNNPPVGAASPDRVLAEVLPQWEVEYYHDLRKDSAAPPSPRPVADWLVITTGPKLLREVEAFINLFLAEVPQVEIEAKIVEVTETKELDLGVRSIDDGTPIYQFPDGKLVKDFSYDFPNQTSGGVVTIGAIQDGLTFNMLIQAAATSNDVEISSMPKIVAREGARAEILNTQELPTYTISSINQAGNFTAGLVYKEIGVKLYIVPAVIGTDTVALYIDIEASQQVGSQSFFVSTADAAEPTELPAPILASRSAKTVVYLKPGEGVILGGLTTERVVKNVRKVPFFGSIPLLGFFFRSTFDRTERTSVLFFIRPRILEGIDVQRQF